MLLERQCLATLRMQTQKRAIQAESGLMSGNGNYAQKKVRVDMAAHEILNKRVLPGSGQIEDLGEVRLPSKISIDLSRQ
jgi:hypothetical protein